MNRRLLTILVFAFVMAAACSWIAFRLVGRRVAVAQKSATVAVVAVNADIKLGTILSAANLTTVQLAGTLPRGAILSPQDAIGRGVISDLYQGEPILENRLAAKGSGGGLAATIRQGMRACAVKVDEVVGVAGFVLPGMRVDVVISGDAPGETDARTGPRVKTLLQNIEVLSAGTDIQKDDEGKPKQVKVVNLLVSPEQAELLSLASNHTQIQLVLRNPLDTEVTKVTGSAMGTLFGDRAVAPALASAKSAPFHARAPRPESVSVEILNGTQRSEQKFAVGGAGE